MVTIVAGWHLVYLEKIREMGADEWAETPGDVVRMIKSEIRNSKSETNSKSE
jgi:hypothetical protein